MISLKRLLIESGLLLELDNKTTLYHRSLHKYNVGDTIDPKVKFGDGSTHWLASQVSEKALEIYRRRNFPDKPSRFNCVYTSIVPNSAFIGKGYLYEVKPIGKWFLTFANYINEINEEFSRRCEPSYNNGGLYSRIFGNMDYPEKERWEAGWMEKYPTYAEYMKAYYAEKEKLQLEKAEWSLSDSFDRYWNPDPSHNIKIYKKWVEVLCEQVKVVGVGEPSKFKFLQKDDKVKLKEDITADWYAYQTVVPNKKYTEEELAKIKTTFNVKKGNYDRETLTLPRGTIATVIVAAPNHTPLPNEHNDNHPDDYKPYRHLRIQPDGFDFYLDVAWTLRHPKSVDNALEKIK